VIEQPDDVPNISGDLGAGPNLLDPIDERSVSPDALRDPGLIASIPPG